jgi:hypothetical protein
MHGFITFAASKFISFPQVFSAAKLKKPLTFPALFAGNSLAVLSVPGSKNFGKDADVAA